MASRGAMKGVSLIKRGWHEIPEIMCCLGLIGLSTALLGVGIARYDKHKNHMYKLKYSVIRDTEIDPEKVRKKVYN